MSRVFPALPAVLLLWMAGCSGTNDGAADGPLVITADKPSIVADGSDKVTFTVKKGDVDVSGKTQLYMVERNGSEVREQLADNTFASRIEGTFVFEAVYTSDKEYTSDKATVTVGKYEGGEEFYRRLFGMQFTSTGCVACPNLTASLDNLPKEYADRLVRASFHTNFSSSYPDPMHLPITLGYMVDVLHSDGGLPVFYLDMIPGTRVVSEQHRIIEEIDKVLEAYPAVCGVKTSSVYDAAQRKLSITFTVKATLGGEYRIVPFIVEDGIVADQTGDRTYVHNTTVRKALSLSLVGDKLGMIEAGAEVTKEYKVSLESSWKPENLRIVVCVLDTADGKAFIGNNSDQCGINESTDYLYNE